MPPRFSLVYPTRHRPAFLAQAISYLEQQTFRDFEVIVSDNWIDSALSCEEICRNSTLQNLKYVRPAKPVGMVENWNFAAGQASGEYVAVFTDKMFLLPDALERVVRALPLEAESMPEIVSWTSDSYQPASYADYFGGGTYTAVQSDVASADRVIRYAPREALHEKVAGLRSRYEQTPSQYCRGKIVFGMYHRNLIERIVKQCGQVFHDISPDYTSMILGLSLANSAVELKSSAVISMNTDLSNGLLGANHDEHALGYLRSLSNEPEVFFRNMLVPGMYAAQHNVVSHDYLSLQRRFNLEFDFDRLNWLGYCIEDLSKVDRVWSSAAIEERQMGLMYAFMGTLSAEEQARVVARLEQRVAVCAPSGVAAGQVLTWQSRTLSDAVARRCNWQ
ncbi:MAG: glycosyltransferase family 2 protein [Gemmatimonadaceae bacterium]